MATFGQKPNMLNAAKQTIALLIFKLFNMREPARTLALVRSFFLLPTMLGSVRKENVTGMLEAEETKAVKQSGTFARLNFLLLTMCAGSLPYLPGAMTAGRLRCRRKC